MIELLNWVMLGLGWLMVLLIFYVVLFRVYYATEGDRPWWIWPAAAVFLCLDVTLNMTVMPILCVDLPRRWTITARMKRYKEIVDTTQTAPPEGLDWYHYYFADSLCKILNLFDKSKDGHC